MNKPKRIVLRKIAYSLYSFSAALLIAGIALPLVAPPALAAPLAQAANYSVQFDTPDYSVCIYTQTTITANGTVTLPAGETATLQTQWYIRNPPDLRTQPAYSYINNVKNGDKFSIDATWPGIRQTDSVVEIHYGAILLDGNGNPLSAGVGLDIFWYPYVCTVPPVVTSTPVTPSPTATATATGTATPSPTDTPTLTPTTSSTAPAGVTPTLTSTPNASLTPTPTGVTPTEPTATATLPVGVTPTLTATLPVGVTPTQTATLPAGVTPTLTTTLPAGVTPTLTAIPTLPAPAADGTPAALIPVTGADLAGPAARLPLAPGMLSNLGLALLGLAVVFHGLSLR